MVINHVFYLSDGFKVIALSSVTEYLQHWWASALSLFSAMSQQMLVDTRDFLIQSVSAIFFFFFLDKFKSFETGKGFINLKNVNVSPKWEIFLKD